MSFKTDDRGILGQIQSDGWIEGGDSANWMGHALYLNDGKFTAPNGKEWDVQKYIDNFEVSFGAYVRHPDPTQSNRGFGAHYEHPWNGCISRDQFIGVLAAVIRGREYKAMLRIILHHACWLFLFTYNTLHNGHNPNETKFDLKKFFFYKDNKENYYKLPDFTFFDIWQMELRGLGWFSWLFWPLLCVLDLHLVGGAIARNKADDDLAISYVIKLLVSREFVPTPVSWLAFKILDRNKAIKDIETYWCGWRQNCGMHVFYVKKIRKFES